MAVQGEVMAGARPSGGDARPRRAPLSPELIAILAVGVALAGVMLTMMMVMMDAFAREMGAVREDVRELRGGQVEIRDRLARVEAGQDDLRNRMARVESKTDLLARELEAVRSGQADLRDRMARVEAKVGVLAGDEPPERSAGTAE